MTRVSVRLFLLLKDFFAAHDVLWVDERPRSLGLGSAISLDPATLSSSKPNRSKTGMESNESQANVLGLAGVEATVAPDVDGQEEQA